MLPVVAGRAATTRQILIYSGLLVIASELPWALGFAGAIYGVIAAACGGLLLLLAYRLNKSGTDRRAAHRLFLFSISYLFVLFAALLVEHSGGSFSRVPAPHTGRNGGWVHAAALPSTALSASGLTNLSAWEV
jgi:protoheme IX farnesyltransferase